MAFCLIVEVVICNIWLNIFNNDILKTLQDTVNYNKTDKCRKLKNGLWKQI